jgi:hypothetical protein
MEVLPKPSPYLVLRHRLRPLVGNLVAYRRVGCSPYPAAVTYWPSHRGIRRGERRPSRLADDSVVWPAAAVSVGGLTLNVGLLKYLGRMERT